MNTRLALWRPGGSLTAAGTVPASQAAERGLGKSLQLHTWLGGGAAVGAAGVVQLWGAGWGVGSGWL